MKNQGMVPYFYDPDNTLVKSICKPATDGGARIDEFTRRGRLRKSQSFSELTKFAN